MFPFDSPEDIRKPTISYPGGGRGGKGIRREHREEKGQRFNIYYAQNDQAVITILVNLI